MMLSLKLVKYMGLGLLGPANRAVGVDREGQRQQCAHRRKKECSSGLLKLLSPASSGQWFSFTDSTVSV